MAKKARTSIQNSEHVPLPPPEAEVLTTACGYCIVACSYKVYRWPVGREGGAAKDQNAFGVDFPTGGAPWIAPSQHNVGMQGSDAIVAINRDPDAPIFKLASFGIVGDLFDVLPALNAEIARVKA